MFDRLGQFVVRYAPHIVVGWLLLFVGLIAFAPPWRSVTKDGEFAFLPSDAPTQRAAEVFRQAFPSGGGMNPLQSNIVIVAHRDDRPRPDEGMIDDDFAFIDGQIVPILQEIAATTGKGYEPFTAEELDQPRPLLAKDQQVIDKIFTRPAPKRRPIFRTSADEEVIGGLLQSDDERASLVYIQLKTEMLDRSNRLVISEVERRILDNHALEKPFGLKLDLSGTAVVGRDVLLAEQMSASRTESLTQWLVVILLLLIYRAPLLALIPLATVGISVHLTQRVLALLAGWDWIGVFTGLEVYVTVVVYGAGVDYCLFLIARYREELDQGHSFSDAIRASVGHVGAALATSAGTSIFGIGMLAFADFGKFSQAGVAISLGLTVVLLLALSLTPALLKLFGRWAFWPDLRSERLEAGTGWLPTLSLSRFLHEQELLDRGWQWIADRLQARPAIVFLGTCAALLPFAVVGFVFQNHLNYGLLTDLPQSDPSVRGARAVQQHFAAGVSGPITVYIQHPHFGLTTPSAGSISAGIVDELRPQLASLGVADIRCQAFPFGLSEKAQLLERKIFPKAGERRFLVDGARKTYASTEPGPLQGQVMRLDLILDQDPFIRESIERLGPIEAVVQTAVADASLAATKEAAQRALEDPESSAAMPPQWGAGALIYTMGPTANLRDLKLITDRDRVRIDMLVVIVVYLLLIALLRQPAICAYLLLSVVFSYLVTLGATYLIFRWSIGAEFAGLDWKIPLFLFTILIAIGEDYNILLMARVTEEQRKHGLIQGVLAALTKTGGIISSCGIIMAGTFASLMTGTLLGMVEMGFALAFGVLLDTFVVRPILVPSYLILLYSGRFGTLGRWLGAPPISPEVELAPAPPSTTGPSPNEDSAESDAQRHGELASK